MNGTAACKIRDHRFSERWLQHSDIWIHLPSTLHRTLSQEKKDYESIYNWSFGLHRFSSCSRNDRCGTSSIWFRTLRKISRNNHQFRCSGNPWRSCLKQKPNFRPWNFERAFAKLVKANRDHRMAVGFSKTVHLDMDIIILGAEIKK